jgi:drug/metabolite transporter (DMT)-like permease
MFGNSSNKTISKKDFFYGFLLSPVAALLLVNSIYLIKVISFDFDNVNQLSSKDIILQSVPFLLGFVALLNYSYLMYKYKCFYMSISGDLIMRSLIFILFLLLGSFLFKKFSTSMIAAAIFCNFLIIVISLVNGKPDIFKNSSGNIPMSFRLVFIDLNLGKVTAFLKNMNILYYAEYVMIGQYKINYSDVSMMESAFNKKLYDFNKDEINVVTMYALN